MKKMILGIACVCALGVATATAQNNNTATCTTQTECIAVTCENATQCVETKCVNNPENCKQDCNKNCPFAGLNLTDSQRQQIKDLNQKYDAQKRALYEQKKDAKTRNDSTKNQIRKQAGDMRAQKLADIKKILTPEQYVQFLENYYLTGNKGKDFRKGGFRDGKHNAFRSGDARPMPQMKKVAKKDGMRKAEKGNR